MTIIKQQRGIVSLVSTIILSLLLLIIIVGLSVVMIGVQRQATDDDQSTRAYYAAEAGVEDGLLTVKATLATHPTDPIAAVVAASHNGQCQSAAVGLATSYVCQTITVQSGAISDVAPQDYANQYEVNQSDNLTRVELYWNLDGKDNQTPAAKADSTTFPVGSAWTYPAVMELTDTAYTTTNVPATSAGTIGSSLPPLTQIAVPRGSALTTGQFGSTNSIDGYCQTGPIDATHPYNCHATFTGFATLPGLSGSVNHVIRLRPRYATAGYQIEFYSTAGIIQVPDTKATIDVTAKSGDVVRRVQAKVKIKPGTSTGLDYVLFADNSVCKTFTIGVGSTEVPSSGTPCP